jgi:hypothetical protein
MSRADSAARKVKDRYRGTCRNCGSPTSGAGPRRARVLCARCNGRASAKWDRTTIEAALRSWYELYGRPATSADLSMSYARKRAPYDHGERLQRLRKGWKRRPWPPASVVQYHFGSFRTANKVALVAQPGGEERPRRSP